MDPSPCAAIQASLQCDAVLEVGGKCFPVNRWALARHSSYFEAMFFGGTRECVERHIRIQGVEAEPFQALLDFTQTGSLGITPGNVASLLQTADFLQLEAAKRRCETFLERELHVSNCLSLRAYAQHFACAALSSAAFNVALSHWADVVTHGEVEELPKATLMELLQSDELFVAREDVVFDTVMQWVVADLPGRAKDFLELVGLVRVPFLSLPFLGLLVKRSQRPGLDAPAQLLKELDRFPPPNWQDAAQAPCASRSYETLFVMAGKRDQEQQELFHFLPKTGAWQACSPLKCKNLTQYAVAAVGNAPSLGVAVGSGLQPHNKGRGELPKQLLACSTLEAPSPELHIVIGKALQLSALGPVPRFAIAGPLASLPNAQGGTGSGSWDLNPGFKPGSKSAWAAS